MCLRSDFANPSWSRGHLRAAKSQVDVGVADGKIAVIDAPGSLASPTRAVDATGRVVIPRGIDPHIHCLSPIWFPG
jgi:dihydroorotase-like cyclic amidohydrolase